MIHLIFFFEVLFPCFLRLFHFFIHLLPQNLLNQKYSNFILFFLYIFARKQLHLPLILLFPFHLILHGFFSQELVFEVSLIFLCRKKLLDNINIQKNYQFLDCSQLFLLNLSGSFLADESSVYFLLQNL